VRVVARGWKRDCGENSIINIDLEDGFLPDNDSLSSYLGGKTYLKKKQSGEVELLVGPHTLNLGGSYQIRVTLSRDDLMALFIASCESVPFAKVIDDLASHFREQAEYR